MLLVQAAFREGTAMATKRPTAVTVIAILNIIFGSLGLLCYACAGILVAVFFGGASALGGQDPDLRLLQEIFESMKRDIPALMPLMIGSMVVGLVLSIILLISGIGLLSLQRWARALSIFYGFTTILTQVGYLLVEMVYLNPAVDRWQRNWLAQHPGVQIQEGGMNANSPLNNLSSYIGAGLSIIYAIILLIIMFQSATVAAFAGRWRGSSGDDYDDWRAEGQRDQDDRWGR
jgi:hypothetical protein